MSSVQGFTIKQLTQLVALTYPNLCLNTRNQSDYCYAYLKIHLVARFIQLVWASLVDPGMNCFSHGYAQGVSANS